MNCFLAFVVFDRASWNVPVEGRKGAYLGVLWIKALSRWMCGCVKAGRTNGASDSRFDVGLDGVDFLSASSVSSS